MVGDWAWYEVIAGGPWLSITVWSGTREHEQFTIDTMQVVSVGTRSVGDERGATRIVTTAGIYNGLGEAIDVTRWVIAARRGLAHADDVFLEDVPHPEAVEKGVYTGERSPDPT